MKKTVRTFNNATLKKVIALIKAKIAIYESGEKVASAKFIEKGNHKTGNMIPVFNIPPIMTCGGNCKACIRHCYAVKDYTNNRAGTVSTSHARNMVALQQDPEKALADLDKQLAKFEKKGVKFVRVHATGDMGLIINGDKLAYGRIWEELAKRHPAICFLAFTKCYDVAREIHFDDLPNFELVLSEWTDELQAPEDLKKRYRTSRAVNELSDARDSEMICPGDCDSCGMCWNLSKTGHDVAFEIH